MHFSKALSVAAFLPFLAPLFVYNTALLSIITSFARSAFPSPPPSSSFPTTRAVSAGVSGCIRVCAGVGGCGRVWAGVGGCGRVWAGVGGCVRVCAVVCVCERYMWWCAF